MKCKRCGNEIFDVLRDDPLYCKDCFRKITFDRAYLRSYIDGKLKRSRK